MSRVSLEVVRAFQGSKVKIVGLSASALEHDTVYVAAGRRGLEVELDPADLATITEAVVGQITRS